MFMRRRFVFIVVIILVIALLLTSCSLGVLKMRNYDNDDKIADKKLEQVIEAISNNDKTAF